MCTNTDVSVHYDRERRERNNFIENKIDVGAVLDSFEIDRGHPGGVEIHSVTDTAIIIIHNKITGKLITKLIARPEQLRRLYRSQNRVPPRKVLKLAYQHNRKKFNEI